MRGAAARALASRKDVDAFQDLVWALPESKGSVDSTSDEIIRAIGQLAGFASEPERKDAVQCLSKLLDERMPSVLYFTVPHTLAMLGDRSGFSHLLGLINSTRPVDARLDAVRAIGHIATPADRQVLEKAAEHVRRQIEFAHLHNENPDWFRPIQKEIETLIEQMDS